MKYALSGRILPRFVRSGWQFKRSVCLENAMPMSHHARAFSLRACCLIAPSLPAFLAPSWPPTRQIPCVSHVQPRVTIHTLHICPLCSPHRHYIYKCRSLAIFSVSGLCGALPRVWCPARPTASQTRSRTRCNGMRVVYRPASAHHVCLHRPPPSMLALPPVCARYSRSVSVPCALHHVCAPRPRTFACKHKKISDYTLCNRFW